MLQIIVAFNPCNFLSVTVTEYHDWDKVTGRSDNMGMQNVVEDMCPKSMEFAFHLLIIDSM